MHLERVTQEFVSRTYYLTEIGHYKPLGVYGEQTYMHNIAYVLVYKGRQARTGGRLITHAHHA